MATVYIATNPHPLWGGMIKIGYTRDNRLDKRITELGRHSGVPFPFPFKCYCAIRLDKAPFASVIEQRLKEMLNEERFREDREFFKTSPSKAKRLLLEIARIMGGKEIILSKKDNKQALEKKRQAWEKERKRAKNFTFKLVGIKPGAKLQFKIGKKIHRGIVCEVADDPSHKKVKFDGNLTSLSQSAAAARKKLGLPKRPVAGTWHWCYKGKALHELRKKKANEVHK